jgi:type II secretory pathway pseudopilin PulG
MTLVEMLVAMLLIAVGLMALLSTLTASGASLVDQRARTGATRVGTQQMEAVRASGFDRIKLDQAAGVYSAPVTQTVDGRPYTVTTAITERDAETNGAVVAGRQTVLHVVTTVAWTGPGGVPRSSRFTTAVARDNSLAAAAAPDTCAAGAAQAIDSINIVPSPATVDASGQPLQPFQATVKLCGFASSSLVQLSWPKEGDGPQSETLTSSDGGITWTATLPVTKFKTTVPEGTTSSLDFELRAASLSQLYAVELTGQSSVPLTIDSAAISQNPIRVESSGNNCNGNKCRNLNQVVFTATASGLDPAVDSLKLKYQLQDGTFREIAMTFNPATGVWSYTDNALTVKYKTGTNQPFSFNATRLQPLATRSLMVPRTVSN